MSTKMSRVLLYSGSLPRIQTSWESGTETFSKVFSLYSVNENKIKKMVQLKKNGVVSFYLQKLWNRVTLSSSASSSSGRRGASESSPPRSRSCFPFLWIIQSKLFAGHCNPTFNYISQSSDFLKGPFFFFTYVFPTVKTFCLCLDSNLRPFLVTDVIATNLVSKVANFVTFCAILN